MKWIDIVTTLTRFGFVLSVQHTAHLIIAELLFSYSVLNGGKAKEASYQNRKKVKNQRGTEVRKYTRLYNIYVIQITLSFSEIKASCCGTKIEIFSFKYDSKIRNSWCRVDESARITGLLLIMYDE